MANANPHRLAARPGIHGPRFIWSEELMRKSKRTYMHTHRIVDAKGTSRRQAAYATSTLQCHTGHRENKKGQAAAIQINAECCLPE